MTCASCVNRIERFLKKTPGVAEAAVNLATEAATIRYLPALAGRAELEGAIEAAGYSLKPAPDGENRRRRGRSARPPTPTPPSAPPTPAGSSARRSSRSASRS